jgi:hypothetical protein
MVVMKYTHVCVCINISLSFSQDISRVVHAKTLRDWLIPAEAAALNVIIRRKRKKKKKVSRECCNPAISPSLL